MSIFLYLVRHSRWLLLTALATSIVSGLGNAALIALINEALGAPRERLIELGWCFLLAGALVLITRTLSQTLFIYLGQRAKATLRMYSIRRIGVASYRKLERQGGAKALAVLTQDLDTIVVLFISLSTLAMQGAVIAGCLGYLGYLSWPVLIFAIPMIGVGARLLAGQ